MKGAGPLRAALSAIAAVAVVLFCHHSVGMAMSTVADVIAFLESYAPPILAEDWDNTGLLVGRRDAQVDKVMTCLTLTADVADEAVEQGVQLVVSHHPLMFRGTKAITDGNVEGRVLLSLIENGVAVYSPHTCFDSAASGVNSQLAESFGLQDVCPIRENADSAIVGGGRLGSLADSEPLQKFLERVRKAVGGAYMEFSGLLTAPVLKVAVACGSAGEFLTDAIRLDCDTFVTGEVQFHTALQARAAGVNLVLLGHYSSERPAVEQLATAIGEALTEVRVFSSKTECDPLSVFTL